MGTGVRMNAAHEVKTFHVRLPKTAVQMGFIQVTHRDLLVVQQSPRMAAVRDHGELFFFVVDPNWQPAVEVKSCRCIHIACFHRGAFIPD